MKNIVNFYFLFSVIPYSHQHIDQRDIDAVIDVLKSDWLTQGPKISAFEKSLAHYCGARYAVVVPNGTAALHLAYRAVGLEDGDEIITTANTFVATTNMAILCRARPIFCDIRLDTYNIDEERIGELITKKTRAIVPVHFAGHPCEMDKISEIAKKHNLLVIEDACHAVGSEYMGRKIGAIGDLTVLSFHPVKSITTGEGGAILTNNQKYYEIMLRLRTHGMEKDPVKQQMIGGWYYEIKEIGLNYRLTDIQCALGISQLEKLDRFQNQREKVANYYFDKLKNIKGVITPVKLGHIKHSWHLFVIRLENQNIRKEVFRYLQEHGIGVQVHYIPVYQHPYYRANGYKDIILKNTEEYYSGCISIPIYPDLTEDQIDFVISKLTIAIQQAEEKLVLF